MGPVGPVGSVRNSREEFDPDGMGGVEVSPQSKAHIENGIVEKRLLQRQSRQFRDPGGKAQLQIEELSGKRHVFSALPGASL